MPALLIIHIAAGIGGLAAGYTSLFATKGGALHRKSGLLFVGLMATMGLTGAVIAQLELTRRVHKPGLQATMLMGLFATYLVVTALTAVRPPRTASRAIAVLSMLAAAGIGLAQLTLGIRGLVHPDPSEVGPITAVELFIGAIALLAAASDLRIIRSAPHAGVKRIARHLWRMTFALWIAAASFFPRLTRFVPAPFGGVIAVPIVAVLAALAYWMWRVRFRRSFRGLLGDGFGQPAGS